MPMQTNLEQLYRRVIMDHYKNPRNRGELQDAELQNGALTINMNNPSCGDRIQLQMICQDGKIEKAKFIGEGCSISMASASMMTEAIRGLSTAAALEMSAIFSQMMLGEKYDDSSLDLGDIEALQGVSRFPARIKCATLAWKAMEKSLGKDDVDDEGLVEV